MGPGTVGAVMSRRPMAGQPNPGRGGDGRRRMWSESPIARVGVRKVRAAGALPVPTGCFSAYSLTPSAAEFTIATATASVLGSFLLDAGDLVFDTTPAGLEVRILSADNVDAEAVGAVPSDWESVTDIDHFSIDWNWAQGEIANVVIELRWTGVALITHFCPTVVDET